MKSKKTKFEAAAQCMRLKHRVLPMEELLERFPWNSNVKRTEYSLSLLGRGILESNAVNRVYVRQPIRSEKQAFIITSPPLFNILTDVSLSFRAIYEIQIMKPTTLLRTCLSRPWKPDAKKMSENVYSYQLHHSF